MMWNGRSLMTAAVSLSEESLFPKMPGGEYNEGSRRIRLYEDLRFYR